MKRRGFMALLIVTLALITAFVACSGNGSTSEYSGCGGCALACTACTACTACAATGCALSCARGVYDVTQTGYSSNY